MKAFKNTKLAEWQQKKYGICEKCGKEKDLNVEHIIPVSILEQLGLEKERYEDEENFAHYCFACNRFKASRLDISNPKTKILLEKYINKI